MSSRFFSSAFFRRATLASLLLGGLFCVLTPLDARAQSQSGDPVDPPTSGNPNGNSGGFSGMVTTAGAYDPLTGNAKRSVTDLVVPGSQGAYPLAFSRTANSRRELVSYADRFFGDAGNWRHSYQWALKSYTMTGGGFSTPYVAYPGGAVTQFSADNVPMPSGEVWYRGAAGTSDRLQVPSYLYKQQSDVAFVLHTADGGQVVFANRGYTSTAGGFVRWVDFFRAEKVIDPHGATTLLCYDDTSHTAELTRVVEPGGRQLLFRYESKGSGLNVWRVLKQVYTTSGQSVTFEYDLYGTMSAGAPYVVLSHVTYDNEPQGGVSGNPLVQAHYNYWWTTVSGDRPLLNYCDDPHYSGPMHHIHYTFDSDTSKWGKVLSEDNAANNAIKVSALAYAQESPPVRFETRGDGPSRGFVYGEATVPTLGQTNAQPFQLTTSTDYSNQAVRYAYNAAGDARGEGFRNAVLDHRNNKTSFDTEPFTGRNTRVTLPDGAHKDFAYTDPVYPYYLASVTDERGQPTYYRRDFQAGANNANSLVRRIDYPDGGYEEFTYVALSYSGGQPFYKLGSRRTRTGAMFYYAYDESGHGGTGNKGLLTTVWHPRGNSNGDLVPVSYWYDNWDRLHQTIDERGKNTWYDLDGAGQLVKLWHHDFTYVGYTYDDYGNRTQVRDELGKITTTSYDDYRRPWRVQAPVDQTNGVYRYTNLGYWRVDNPGAGSYTHTTANPCAIWLPSNKVSYLWYDENWRTSQRMDAPGAGSDQSTTTFTYDANGNLTHTKTAAPDGHLYDAASDYDSRNRLWHSTTPNGQTTTYGYDNANNLTWMTLPLDPGSRTYSFGYDAMNRRTWTQDPRGEISWQGYDTAGNLTWTWEGRSNQPVVMGYVYDLLSRRTGTGYQDGSWELWTYDDAGNAATFQNRAGQVRRTRGYDDRNRSLGYDWDGGTAPSHGFAYDATSRVTVAENWHSHLEFTYNDAGELLAEQQNVAYANPLYVRYTRNTDGLIDTLTYPNGAQLAYTYTARNQLATVRNVNLSTPFAIFTYNADGSRYGLTRSNSTTVNYAIYDQAGRMTLSRDAKQNPFENITCRTYGYGATGKLSWWTKENDGVHPTENGRGDAYMYFSDDQLSLAHHDALAVAGSVDAQGNSYAGAQPQSTQRYCQYTYDAAGNRLTGWESSVAPGGGTQVTLNQTYSPDALNRYAGLCGYDTRGNTTSFAGFTYGYDAEGHLTSIGGAASASFQYDPLGRLCRRTIGTLTNLLYYDLAWNEIEERDSAGATWSRTWVHGAGRDETLLFADNGTGNKWLHQDPVTGDVIALSDDQGHVVERYAYDAFGTPYSFDAAGNPRAGASSAYGQRQRWKGLFYYPSLGVSYMRNRFYSPALGRFLSPDPIGQAGGLNLYAYCKNDPINLSDPSGLTDRPTAETEENQTQPAGRPSHTSYNGGYDGPVRASGVLDGVPIVDPTFGNGSGGGIGSDGRVVAGSGAPRSTVISDFAGLGIQLRLGPGETTFANRNPAGRDDIGRSGDSTGGRRYGGQSVEQIQAMLNRGEIDPMTAVGWSMQANGVARALGTGQKVNTVVAYAAVAGVALPAIAEAQLLSATLHPVAFSAARGAAIGSTGNLAFQTQGFTNWSHVDWAGVRNGGLIGAFGNGALGFGAGATGGTLIQATVQGGAIGAFGGTGASTFLDFTGGR